MTIQVPEKPRDVVTIVVAEETPDLLARIEALNTALLRVTSRARLVKVREADYDAGRLEVIVEATRARPRTSPRVRVRYRPLAA